MYISKRGYAIVKELNIINFNELKRELTVKPDVPNSSFGIQKCYDIYQESKKNIYVPRNFGIEKWGLIDSRIPEGDTIKADLEFSGELRDYQQVAVKSCMKCINDPEKTGGILQLSPGLGKTAIGIYLISQIRKKTLIIVHQDFLLNQWRDRINQFLPGARIGEIRQKKVDIKDKDIVIGMLQSISMKDYSLNTFDSFGMLIVDECHHIGSEIFSKALFKVGCKYRIGLSATPDRKDGLEKVIKWHIGDVMYSAIREVKGYQPKVEIYQYHDKEQKEILTVTGDPNIPRMLTDISKNVNRNRHIVENLYLLNCEGRTVLVLSERVKHLECLELMYNEYQSYKNKNSFKTALYMGKTKQEDRELSENANIIFASLTLIKEGYDNPNLDTIVFATINNGPRDTTKRSTGGLEQMIGRILRKTHTKIYPLIVDYQDQFSCFKSQGSRRKRYYNFVNYSIRSFRIKDNKIEKIKERKKIKTEPGKGILNFVKKKQVSGCVIQTDSE